jgi:predicted  nucleic acid-binding Zn-ribbon protein
MEDAARPRLSLLQSVRCLECGEVYSKPSEGGTVTQNPGCPGCGYVGWLSVSLPSVSAPARRGRGDEQLRRPSAQSG